MIEFDRLGALCELAGTRMGVSFTDEAAAAFLDGNLDVLLHRFQTLTDAMRAGKINAKRARQQLDALEKQGLDHRIEHLCRQLASVAPTNELERAAQRRFASQSQMGARAMTRNKPHPDAIEQRDRTLDAAPSS